MGVIERPRVTRDVSRRRPTGRVRTQRGYTTMANRRKFLAGLGALASGSAAAVGTGAFTSVEASRDVTVSLASDSNAFLQLEALDSNVAEQSDGTLALDFSGDNSIGNGLNPDATTNFLDVFKIGNQGQNDVAVRVDARDEIEAAHGGITGVVPYETETTANEAGLDYNGEVIWNPSGGPDEVSKPAGASGGHPVIQPNGRQGSPLILGPGDYIHVGFQITTDSTGYQAGDRSADITVLAVEPGSDRDIRDPNSNSYGSGTEVDPSS